MGVPKLLYGHPKPLLGHPKLPPWVFQLLLWASHIYHVGIPNFSLDIPRPAMGVPKLLYGHPKPPLGHPKLPFWVSQLLLYYVGISNLHWGIPNSHPGYPNCYCGHPNFSPDLLWVSQRYYTPIVGIPIPPVVQSQWETQTIPGCPKIFGHPNLSPWASHVTPTLFQNTRQLHGYGIPTWVVGMGTMWVWWVSHGYLKAAKAYMMGTYGCLRVAKFQLTSKF
ncbi:hypothetical protein BU15DRAFT_68887 [Melanogaster broomeanus]|nr:hypothetical protein BU15DRAFT_68887 [Melanogaster broomeanus]